jgi:glutaredoxin
MTVEIFSTSWCAPCKYLTKYLDLQDVKYVKYDVEENMEAYNKMMELSGASTVPQILFEGKDIIIGFDKKKVDEYIKEANNV